MLVLKELFSVKCFVIYYSFMFYLYTQYIYLYAWNCVKLLG